MSLLKCSVTSSHLYFIDPKHAEECGIMIAHYFNFLVSVSHYIYFGLYCIFTKFSEHNNEMSTSDKVIYRRNVFGTLGNLLFPLFSWIIIKCLYWFTLTVLVMAIESVPNQLTYFINLRETGT